MNSFPNGPDYAEIPENVKSYLLHRGDAFMSEGAPDLDKIRTHTLESLRALLFVQHYYEKGATLNTAKSRVFYATVKMLVSPRPNPNLKPKTNNSGECLGSLKNCGNVTTYLLQSIACEPKNEEQSDSDDEDSTDDKDVWKSSRHWMPLQWAGLLGDRCVLADFQEIAADHADELAAGSSEDVIRVPSAAHFAAAAAEPSMQVLEAMSRLNPLIFCQKDVRDAVPLHYAARFSENLQTLKYLLQKNTSATRAVANSIITKEIYPGTPLCHLLIRRSTAFSIILSFLICLLDADPGSIDITGRDGRHILHIAIITAVHPKANGWAPIIRELLRRKPEAAASVDNKGFLPLHYACMRDSSQALELVDQLLEAYPAGISIRAAESGYLPIDLAVSYGTMAVVKRLLAVGSAQAVETNRHPHGLNPMHSLRHREIGDADRIACMLHDANSSWIRAQSSAGWLPLHDACSEHRHALIHAYIAWYPEGVHEQAPLGYLPIHFLRILEEPNEELTPDDISSIKLLVAAWPESANISPTTSLPDDTVYNAARTKGLVDMQRFILRLCPACEPSDVVLCQLNYMPRRAMLMLLFAEIQVGQVHSLVFGMRQLNGTSMLHLMASFL
jgi:ankyrin repeat protein